MLGPGYQARTLPLRPSYDGDVVATLVSHRPSAGRPVAVLHVHGYCDYFFQTHLAEAWAAAGCSFHAVDLRRHGRSLRPGQAPGDVRSLREHHEDLEAAVAVLRGELGHDRVVVHGHSTGGLAAALWAHERRGDGAGGATVDALVLDSPWLDLQGSAWQRSVGTWAVAQVARVRPAQRVAAMGTAYGPSLHTSTGGAWDYDLGWKPLEGWPVRAGWFRAIRHGHDRVGRGLVIDAPVLVACSSASAPTDLPSSTADRADAVLDVDQIVARAPGLGPDVTVVRIDGGVHDLCLSAPVARQRYLDVTTAWVQERVAPA